MGRRCCITGCSSSSRLPEHQGVTYHSFPLDHNTRSLWLRLTRLSSERQITKSVLVCSRHFKRADFQPQRSGKYLLKQRVFPTVFPWGKRSPAEIEADHEFLRMAFSSSAGVNTTSPSEQPSQMDTTASSIEEDTKATVAATVAQIMAQAAELNASTSIQKQVKDEEKPKVEKETVQEGNSVAASTQSQSGDSNQQVRFEPITTFNPGTRLEAQDFEGVWHSARVVEVDNDDCEVLIKFERTGKNKSAPIVGTEEWIPMNSTRLRKRAAMKPALNFTLEEKCMARWSGPKKFPGTVKKILGNDSYEVLFDDGYIKNVRGVHMSKIHKSTSLQAAAGDISTHEILRTTEKKGAGIKRSAMESLTPGSAKKKAVSVSKRDWPLLDLAKLDLDALNLPHIPTDGEWTCYWVNDQPIGRQGFLTVGEHRKPTVIVEDWRLPPGWVKHMYQRSNVLGKWDVILVTPSGKRFRSKSDLKAYLEEHNLVYNPDIYDFSIHRRRAKDLNCYVYTEDYVPQYPVKTKSFLSELDTSDIKMQEATNTTSSISANNSLSTPAGSLSTIIDDKKITNIDTKTPKQLLSVSPKSSPAVAIDLDGANSKQSTENINPIKCENGYVLVGDLQVQIVDNLFRCPEEGCTKNFRKENHLQIHIKHYHRNLAKLLGSCPKMVDLAEKLSHPEQQENHEHSPKSAMPSTPQHTQTAQRQQPQSAESGKSSKRSTPLIKASSQCLKYGSDNETPTKETPSIREAIKCKIEGDDDTEVVDNTPTDAGNESEVTTAKILKYSAGKRFSLSRKSNRQRTTRRFMLPARSKNWVKIESTGEDEKFDESVTDMEETRHSFNATPDITPDFKKRGATSTNSMTPLSGVDSPITADSGSGSFAATSSNENDMPQYIKENGELIKIVHMRQEEIINCICGYGEEDGLMIQCELCLCWQHGFCNNIDKESEVPEKYICFICRNPQHGRDSFRFRHDQDWLFEGKLPVGNYHQQDIPRQRKRTEILKRNHTYTGNLLELKDFMHSLRVKLSIARNKQHPKLYLWAKKWNNNKTSSEAVKLKTDFSRTLQDNKDDIKTLYPDMPLCSLPNIKTELMDDVSMKTPSTMKEESCSSSPIRTSQPQPHVPQPEAAIDSTICQQNLLEHIKSQQGEVLKRLDVIEAAIAKLEQEDEMLDLKDADAETALIVNRTFIKELDTMKQLTQLNLLEHNKLKIKALGEQL